MLWDALLGVNAAAAEGSAAGPGRAQTCPGPGCWGPKGPARPRPRPALPVFFPKGGTALVLTVRVNLKMPICVIQVVHPLQFAAVVSRFVFRF